MENGAAEEHPAIDAILTIVGETHKIVKRIDDRTRHSRDGRRFKHLIQEACFHYWQLGQQNATVRFGQTGRVTYESVFSYYKRQLCDLGIHDATLFKKQIKATIQRKYRENLKSLFDSSRNTPSRD